jgi:hypothetical protein
LNICVNLLNVCVICERSFGSWQRRPASGYAQVLAAERTAVMSIVAMSLMVLWFT